MTLQALGFSFMAFLHEGIHLFCTVLPLPQLSEFSKDVIDLVAMVV